MIVAACFCAWPISADWSCAIRRSSRSIASRRIGGFAGAPLGFHGVRATGVGDCKVKWLMRGLSVLLVLCGVALAALLYYRAGHPRTIPVPDTIRAQATLPIGQLTPLEPKLPAPDLGFTTRRGEPKRLADFTGRPSDGISSMQGPH